MRFHFNEGHNPEKIAPGMGNGKSPLPVLINVGLANFKQTRLERQTLVDDRTKPAKCPIPSHSKPLDRSGLFSNLQPSAFKYMVGGSLGIISSTMISVKSSLNDVRRNKRGCPLWMGTFEGKETVLV